MRSRFRWLNLFALAALLLSGYAPLAVAAPAHTPAAMSSRVPIRWYVGLGVGTGTMELAAQQAVVDDFNASQSSIALSLEIVNNQVTAVNTLASEMAAGQGPDLVGPVGWLGANAFYGQWLDLAALVRTTHYDTTQFNPALVNMYQTEAGQVGLPFSVYPAALFYNKALFDQAGLHYPPAAYGQKYQMPDGALVEWNWDTVAQVGKRLTRDASGNDATQAGFDRNNVAQYGYTWQYQRQHPSYWGTYWAPGSMFAAGDVYQAQAPAAWQAAWQWTYAGTWAAQPFISSAPVDDGSFGDRNIFNTGKVAMTDQPVWYLPYLTDLKTWEVAAMPSYNGQVAGRVDADTFRIWKGTAHPQEAFTVLTYLIGAGVQKLIIGSQALPAAYGAVPARATDQAAWLAAKKTQYPWVAHWDTLLAGLNYPDVPSAEGWMPFFNDAWNRGLDFSTRLTSTPGLTLTEEIATYVSDLNEIFRKANVTVAPAAGGSLVYTTTVGTATTVTIPPGAVTGTTNLAYTPLPIPTAPAGFGFAGQVFQINAYQQGALVPGFVFSQPVTITLHYSDADILGLDESKLKLDYWNGTTWVDAACGPYDRHPAENWLAAPVCHLSRFALFGAAQIKTFLPLTVR